MAERVGDPTPEHERHALVSLATAGLPVSAARTSLLAERFGHEHRPLAAVYDALATRTASGERRVPRLVVLDQLVRLARSAGVPAPDAAADHRALQGLIGELVAEGRGRGVVDPATDGQVAVVHRALTGLGPQPSPTALGQQGSLTAAGAWDQFVLHAGDALALTPAERAKPMCDDGQQVTASGHTAQVVESVFHTAQPVAQVARWVDPREWPRCSLFFTAMVPLGPIVEVGGAFPGWNGEFEEHVMLGNPPLVTPLRFRYRADPGGAWVRCDYDLVAPTADIVVDEGFLWVGHDPSAPPGRPTLCRCAKVIRFSNPDWQHWTTVSCDTFWTELSMVMATSCGDLGPGGAAGTTSTGSATGTTACDELIDAGTELVRESLDLWGSWTSWAQSGGGSSQGGTGP